MDVAPAWFWISFGGMLLSSLVLWTLQGAAVVALRRGRSRVACDPRVLEPISILKPLKGVDPTLRENLEAFLVQDYPEFEILFGVEDPADPVVPVVRAFLLEHPHAPLRLFVGLRPKGLNPKVSILRQLVSHARHPWLLISDADVRPGADYLRVIGSELASGVALVHNVLASVDEHRAGSILEGLHMNAFVAATSCGAELVRHPCVIGKSMLFDRRALDAIGGFTTVENVLAEDYLLGQAFFRADLGVRLSSYRLPIRNPERDIRSFFGRHLRWAQMRRWVSPRAYFSEAFGNPLAWLALWLPSIWSSTVPGSPWSWAGLALSLATAKCAGDLLVARLVRGDHGSLRHAQWIVVKDLLIAAIWLLGWAKRRVDWRGNLLWIGPGSHLSPGARPPPSEFAVRT